MRPTVMDGDRLLVRWGATPTPGRLVVVTLPPSPDGPPRPLAVKRAVRHGSDGWWIERDSPTEGVDSWQVGAVPDEAVQAVVVARLWPRPARAFPDPHE